MAFLRHERLRLLFCRPDATARQVMDWHRRWPLRTLQNDDGAYASAVATCLFGQHDQEDAHLIDAAMDAKADAMANGQPPRPAPRPEGSAVRRWGTRALG